MPGWSLDLNRLREMRGPGESYSDMIHNWRRRTHRPAKNSRVLPGRRERGDAVAPDERGTPDRRMPSA